MEWRKMQRLEQLGPVLHAKYRFIYGLTVCIFLSFIAFYLLVPISYARTDIFIPKSLFAWFSSSLSSTSPVYDSNTGEMIYVDMIGSGESVILGKDGEFRDKDGIFENATEENLTLGGNDRSSEEKDSILDGTQEKNLTLGVIDSSPVEKKSILGGTQEKNLTSRVNDPEEKKTILDGTHNKNLNLAMNDGSSWGKDTNLERTDDEKNPTFVLLNNGSSEAKRLESVAVYDKLNETERNVVGNVGECDIFYGKWVRDDKRKLYYNGRSCPYIDTSFDCHKNGRPDYEFLKWRWQPNGCNIPSLNATDFLERLRGKRLVFVGDSLNRNMWESLVCILHQSVANKKRVYEISGRRNFKAKGYYGFIFKDYNFSVNFARSTFLVRETYHKGAHGIIDEKLRLDLMDETASAYRKADIIVFNTGHWWTHEKTSRGVNYYQEGNHVHPVLKVSEAYKKALTTWAKWVDKNINPKKTRVYFRGYALTHFKGGQWNSGGKCNKETEPISNETFLVKYPSKMRTFEQVLKRMKTPVMYLNISRLTDYRKDGHPSIYVMKYNTLQEQISAEMSQDCSHWCLPGVPDTWNELLYASLLMDDR